MRVVLLAAGALAMALGLYAGLYRIGWPVPAGAPLAEIHGPLVVSGFFGTLINLERAVALHHPWAYAAPLAAALGAAALLMGTPAPLATGLFALAGLAAVANGAVVVRLQPTLFNVVLLVGAFSWLIGNAHLMIGTPMRGLAGWWLVFFVATIAAERLELSRLLQPPAHAKILFVMLIGLLVAGAALGIDSATGSRLLGVGFFGLALWLWRYDIARSTVRRTGQTRFFAVNLLAGYVWLGFAGAVATAGLIDDLAYGYDVVLHLVLIGFVISMVFAHALIILPAVIGLRLIYTPWLYLPVLVLQVSVALRVTGGLAEHEGLRLASSVFTLAAILAFAATLLAASLGRGRLGTDRRDIGASQSDAGSTSSPPTAK